MYLALQPERRPKAASRRKRHRRGRGDGPKANSARPRGQPFDARQTFLPLRQASPSLAARGSASSREPTTITPTAAGAAQPSSGRCCSADLPALSRG